MEQFIADVENQSAFDWIVLLSGILYVVYAARNNPVCWIWGIISCAILAYMSTTKYMLYADGMLNVFYVIMGVIGIYHWQFGKKGGSLPITRISIERIITYIIVGIIASIAISYLLGNYTQAAATGLDSFTTVFSIIATIWLVKRYIENWILWILVDIAYMYLYWSRGAVLYFVLFIVYTAIAFQGYMTWRRLIKMA